MRDHSLCSHAFNRLGIPILFPRTHTRASRLRMPPRRPSISSELQIRYPQNLRTMCSELCATPFSESASGVPTTPMPTDLITGLLPEQHWMVAAEKRVRSDCCPNRRISHGSQTRMRFYLYPHKRMTASEQTYSENFELCLWRGIPFLCVFFLNNQI